MQRIVASVLWLITSPLVVIVYFLILAIDGRPVVFEQYRIGRHNSPFTIYKFKTMVNGEITPLGRILRKTHLDELPQLLNIVVGDMEFIGPRPEQIDLVYSFEAENSQYIDRHIVRPGITGLAQVKLGHTAHWKQKLIWDLEYIEKKCFILDMKIYFWTFLDCLGLEGR